MRKFFKYFLFVVLFVFHGFMFSVVNYVFPHYDVTRVTGVEVKRVDKDGPITKANPADGPTAQAQAMGNENKLVQIKYYGWRLTMFDEFRNAVSVKEIDGDATPSYPILSWLFYAFLLVTLFLSIQFVRGWFDSEK